MSRSIPCPSIGIRCWVRTVCSCSQSLVAAKIGSGMIWSAPPHPNNTGGRCSASSASPGCGRGSTKPESTTPASKADGRARRSWVTISPPCEKPNGTIFRPAAVVSIHANSASVAARSASGCGGCPSGTQAKPRCCSVSGARTLTQSMPSPNHGTIPARSCSSAPKPCSRSRSGRVRSPVVGFSPMNSMVASSHLTPRAADGRTLEL